MILCNLLEYISGIVTFHAFIHLRFIYTIEYKLKTLMVRKHYYYFKINLRFFIGHIAKYKITSQVSYELYPYSNKFNLLIF